MELYGKDFFGDLSKTFHSGQRTNGNRATSDVLYQVHHRGTGDVQLEVGGLIVGRHFLDPGDCGAEFLICEKLSFSHGWRNR